MTLQTAHTNCSNFCPLKQTANSTTKENNDNQTRIWNIENILPSDPDYEWWIHNHAFMAHQA